LADGGGYSIIVGCSFLGLTKKSAKFCFSLQVFSIVFLPNEELMKNQIWGHVYLYKRAFQGIQAGIFRPFLFSMFPSSGA
jgi:hypothetical protein